LKACVTAISAARVRRSKLVIRRSSFVACYTAGMIPLRDVIPSRTVPVVTIALIVINALVFLHELTLAASGGRTLDAFIGTYGFIPSVFSWSTIFTSMFLHSGWLHIFGNMLSLWIFGDNVEDRMGHGRYLVFYLLCGLVAALAHAMTNLNSSIPTIGASGAIAGVMGAYFVLYPHSRVLTLIPLFIFFQIIEVPAVIFLGFWFVLQLLSGVGSGLSASGEAVGGVAFWAHVAGFATGALTVKVFARRERSDMEWWDVPPTNRL
jgi:membrane associated rhomboid family serine protease